MPTECVFTLPTGRKCRCMATRGYAFCRHHGAPRQPRIPPYERGWSRLRCWRALPHEYLEDPVEELPGRMLYVLYALLEDIVSDRHAGRCLRILLKRLNAIPLIVAPEFEQPPVMLPPAPPAAARKDSPEDAAERARLLQWAQSLMAPGSMPRSQPPVAQSRPSAPSLAAVR
ncbi:MAG: hypothetical protein WCA44_00760 [Acidobacteriaceae bacterium]|jgi:hypothetical protein